MMEGKAGSMNLDDLVKKGRLPWSPNPDVSCLDVWHQYEHPMAGTFRTHGKTVFFTVVVEFGNTSVWAYTCLPAAEAKRLTEVEFESPAALRECAEQLLAGHKVAFALAADLLIMHWSVHDEDGSLEELGLGFLNEVYEGLKSSKDPATMLRAKLAQVDTASTELVDA
jgi:hypothetical protein